MLFTQRPCDPFFISRAATHFRPREKNKYPPFCGWYLRIRHNMQIDQIKFKFNFIFIPSPKMQAIDWTTPWFSQRLDTEKTTIHYLKQPGMSYQRIHASLGPNELITNSTRQKKILPFRYRLFLFLVNFSCIKITSYSIWIYPCVHFIDTFHRQKLCHHCPRQPPVVPTVPRHYMSNDAFDSSPPSSAYMRQWTRSALAQTMSRRLIGAKPPTEPMLEYC